MQSLRSLLHLGVFMAAIITVVEIFAFAANKQTLPFCLNFYQEGSFYLFNFRVIFVHACPRLTMWRSHIAIFAVYNTSWCVDGSHNACSEGKFRLLFFGAR